MDHQKKLDFVLKMTKHALDSVQHFADGGTALGGPIQAGNPNASDPTRGIAGTVGNFLGTNNNFQATGATLNPGTNTAQLNQAYSGAQGALNAATNLAGTLTPGVAQGVGIQNTLAGQLQGQAVGQGPNPAQAALNQATGENIARAAAIAAGTRGAGANAGLIASNAAQQGANLQQQAVGQGATLQAQQQLAAQQQLQGLAAQQVGQGTNAVQLQNQTQQNEQNILQGANTATNNAAVSQQNNINATNAAVSAGNQNADQNVIGGIASGIGKVGGAIAGLFHEGGTVIPDHIGAMRDLYHPHLAEGGAAWQYSTPVASTIDPGVPINLPAYTGPSLASQIEGSGSGAKKSESKLTANGTNPTGVGGTYGFGGQQMVEDLGNNSLGVSAAPSELQLPELGASLSKVAPLALMSKGGSVSGGLKEGGKVPGKPKVNHNDMKNDTVSAKLSPGEVVIDLNTLNDKGKLGQMARFVAQNIERKKMGRSV